MTAREVHSILVAVTPRWSESLVKTHIDQALFPAPADCSADERGRIDELRFLCQGVFQDVERVVKVRQRVARAAARGEPSETVQEVVEAIEAELDEIAADLGFAASRRGRFVLFVNDWAQSWHADLRHDPRFVAVSIGALPDREVVAVTGEVGFAEDLADLARLVGRHAPGVPVEFRVTVAAQRGA